MDKTYIGKRKNSGQRHILLYILSYRLVSKY